MTLTSLARLLLLIAGLSTLGGCGAVSAVSGASERLDAYTLQPLSPQKRGRAGAGHLIVEEPTASGALATDRILVKPNPIQAQYLPGARWIDPAPVLIQTLLLQSFDNAGGFRLVSRQAAGLMPDYTLMTEMRAFQAEVDPSGGPQMTVRVGLTLTLIRESDRRIIASRQVERVAIAPSDAPLSVVSAFEAAVASALSDAVTWATANARGGSA